MEPVPLVITPVQASQGGELIELARETYYDTFVSMGYYNHEIVTGYLDSAFAPAKLERELEDPDCHYFFVGTKNASIIGYLKLVNSAPLPALKGSPAPTPVASPLYLERIYLQRDAQGKGLGRAMLALCEDIAADLAAKHIWLTVWEYNIKAISFYEKTGFSRIGKTQFAFTSQGKHYVDTDHVYLKELVLEKRSPD